MEVPELRNYGISPQTGFLPEQAPVHRLPCDFDAWEDIAQDLPALIRASTLRQSVDEMPYLHAGKLATVEEQRRAYSILGFLANAYVWSPPSVCDKLPKQLSDPLLTLSSTLGLPPLSTYAGLCLWNFRTECGQDVSANWTLDDLQTLTLFTGGHGEAWFYLVSVALEKQGGPCLEHGIESIKACLRGDIAGLMSLLKLFAEDIESLTDIMMRLPENLDPHWFYHTLRPYLAGWRGMEKAGLPNGIYYGDEAEPRKYSGGSNGQSSIVQALDIILNVDHYALGHRAPLGPMPKPPREAEMSSARPTNNAYLTEMREYMPREHREFLTALEKCAVVRPFVVAHGQEHPELIEAYDHCLQMLRTFRSKHIQIVMRYVLLPSKTKTKGVGLSSSEGGGAETGTGGTELMPFLKQTRDEVSDTAAGNWGRSILSTVYPSKSVEEEQANDRRS